MSKIFVLHPLLSAGLIVDIDSYSEVKWGSFLNLFSEIIDKYFPNTEAFFL